MYLSVSPIWIGVGHGAKPEIGKALEKN